MEKELYIDFADEVIYQNTFQNGIKCFIIPKKGFMEKQAVFAVNYGSADNVFIKNGNVKKEPEGIAHFIEHKLFEQEDYDVFERFSKYGASSNAFTNFNTTAYYFNCTENFDKNLGVLLDFVSKPYFTKDNVQKEKDIISQEIKMYDDDPSWKIYFNMLKALYFDNAIKNDIAGTVDTINNITDKMLYENYKDFYTYKNAVVVCAGDFDRNMVYDAVMTGLNLNQNSDAEKLFYKEKGSAVNSYVSEKMSVERTLFNIGVKDNSKETDSPEKILGTKILLDIICGESSEFYEHMYEKRFIDKSFSYAYTCGRDYGFAVISGFSEKPEAVKEFLLDEVYKFRKRGIDSSLFAVIKDKYIGKFIKGFDSIDGIVSAEVDLFTKGITLYDYARGCETITLDYVYKILFDLFSENNITLSTIVP